MNDALIRKKFHELALEEYHASPNTLVVDELGLRHGSCRADIAVVNGKMIGFEIKGDTDTLKRLPVQVRAYNAVFDRAAVITTVRHKREVLSRLPKWWGLIVCHTGSRRTVRFETFREAEVNLKVDPLAVAQLLWKTEVVSMLSEFGEPPSLLRRPRARLYERLVEVLELPRLQRRVRDSLRKRKNWRDLGPLFQGAD